MYMRNLHLFFGILFFLCFSTIAFSQVTIIANDNFAETGDSVEINITVENYEEIISTQFAFFWEPTVINYRRVKNFGLNGMSNQSFGFAQIDEGKLRFSWADPLGNPQTVDDDHVLFTVVYDVIGQAGDASNLEIGNCDIFPVLEIEIGDADGNAIDDFMIVDGDFNVGTTSTNETRTIDYTLFQNQPNPFTTRTNIQFDLKNHTDTYLSIYDYTGKVIYEEVKKRSSGTHTITLKKDIFPAAGTYFYRLKTNNAESVRTLIVQ